MTDEEPAKEANIVMNILTSYFSPLPLSIMALVLIVLGVGIAVAIHQLGDKDNYNKRIGENKDDAWLYLAAIIFARMVVSINFQPIQYKSKIMLGGSGNLRTNMTIYKALKADGTTNADAPAVVMVADGPTGSYNRANRSLTHFTETVPSILLMLATVGRIFPFPAFIIVIVYSYGRVAHQKGEAAEYGKHGPGFGLALLSGFVLEGLCWVCAAQAFGFMP